MFICYTLAYYIAKKERITNTKMLDRLNYILYVRFVYLVPFILALGIGGTAVVLPIVPVYILVIFIVGLGSISIYTAVLYICVRYMAYMVLTLCIGAGIFIYHSHFVYSDVLRGMPKQVHIQGTVKNMRFAPQKTQMRLTDVVVDNMPVRGDVRLNVKYVPTPYPKRVSLNARLYPPAQPIIPDAFDFRSFAKYNGIYAFGKGIGDITVIQPQPKSFSYKITQHIYTYMSDRIGAVAVALITGNRVGMQAGDVTALRGSGLAHLLAISGLHLGLVMGVLYVFIRGFCCLVYPQFFTAYPIKQIASVISLAGALLYCIIADFPTPTVRAFLMGAIVVIGVLTHAKAFTMRSVSLVATGILLFSPDSLFSVSFQLSFIAVMGLVAVFAIIPYKKGIRAMVYRVCIASSVAMLVTLPFSAYHFGTVAVYSVGANMLAVPMMAVSIAPLLMVSVFEYILMGTGYSLHLVEVILTYLLHWANVVMDLPHSVFYTGSFPILLLLLFLIALLIAIHSIYHKMGILCVFVTIFVIVIYPNTLPDIIVGRQGKIAILQDNAYILPTKARFYFTDAIRKQTGISKFTSDICKTQCVINGVLYTDSTDIQDIKSICTAGVYRFIVAPNAILNTCATPSYDRADRIINQYTGAKIHIPLTSGG